MAACGSSQSIFLKLPINGEDVIISVTPELVQALNSEYALVRHHAYELVAREVKMQTDQPETNVSCIASNDLSNTAQVVACMQPRSDDQTKNLNPKTNDSNAEPNGCSNIQEFCPSQVHLWKDDEIKGLLALRFAIENEFNSAKNHEVLWQHITSELNNMGINVSCLQARNKFNTLKKYKEVVDANGKTGNSTQHWRYFEQFQESYGHKASTIPASTYDSTRNMSDPKDLNNNEEKDKRKDMKAKCRKRSNFDQLMSKIEKKLIRVF